MGKDEIRRKVIHFACTIIPIGILYLPRSVSLIIMSILFAIAVITELLRRIWPTFGRLFNKFFGDMLRDYEVKGITGATYLLFSSILALTLFPKRIVALSLLFLTVGDGAATIFGRFLGKKKIFGDKTLEGTVAFFLSSLLVSTAISGVPFHLKFSGVCIATLLELFNRKLDDNLVLPLGTAMGMVVVRKICP